MSFIRTPEINVKCLSLDNAGEGLFFINPKSKVYGKAPGLLPKEEAVVGILPTKAPEGEIQRCIVRSINKPSKERVNCCSMYPMCGGCSLIHASRAFREEYLANYITNLFKDDIKIKKLDVLWDKRTEGYRHKYTASLGYKGTDMTYGFYQEGTRHIVSIDTSKERHCSAQTPLSNKIMLFIFRTMKALDIPAFDDKKGIGLVRYIELRETYYTHEVLVTFVTVRKEFPGAKEMVKRLLKAFPEVKTVVQNINGKHTPVVLGEEEISLYGTGIIREQFGDISYLLGSKTFFQVNPFMAHKLYDIVKDMADLKGNEMVLDCYSGVGTIGMYLAQGAKKVLCIEANPDSHQLGLKASRYNKIENIDFIKDDATHYLEKCAKNKTQADVVILDPPRSGSTEIFLKSVLKVSPQKVIYVSCGPETLKRDLKILEKEYIVKDIKCVDMFPGTAHIETVCLLTKKA